MPADAAAAPVAAAAALPDGGACRLLHADVALPLGRVVRARAPDLEAEYLPLYPNARSRDISAAPAPHLSPPLPTSAHLCHAGTRPSSSTSSPRRCQTSAGGEAARVWSRARRRGRRRCARGCGPCCTRRESRGADGLELGDELMDILNQHCDSLIGATASSSEMN